MFLLSSDLIVRSRSRLESPAISLIKQDDVTDFSFPSCYSFSLLGTQMFANTVKFTSDDLIPQDITDPDAIAPRANFDSLYMALTTVFIIFIGEDWQNVMFSYYRIHGVRAMLFFLIMLIFLHIVMLNLFLAIIINNFTDLSRKHDY